MLLITGGTGYIGSHTAVKLLEQNQNVIILDNLYNSKKDVLTNIETITTKAHWCLSLELMSYLL